MSKESSKKITVEKNFYNHFLVYALSSLLLLVFLASGCQRKAPEAYILKVKGEKEGYLLFKTNSPVFDVEFEYPENAEIKAYPKKLEENIYLIGLNRYISSIDRFKWRLTVSKEEPTKAKNAREAAEKWLKFAREDLNAKIYYNKKITLDGVEGWHYSYTFLVDKKEN